MKRLAWIIMCTALLLIPFNGCKGSSDGKTIRFDIDGPVDNLDPQFATNPTARMIIENLYEGLVIRSAEGAILPGVAKSHSISTDRLIYTFTLRRDALWPNGESVTAGDFVFAFQRMFESGSISSHAWDYSAIENAQAILSGELPASRLGVKSQGDDTVIITLDRPDPFLLERVADTPAKPCNKTFFDESRGRYGLEEEYVMGNGPFALSRWDNTRSIQLKASETYHSDLPVTAGGVNLYIGRDPVEQFLGGNTELAAVSYEYFNDLTQTGIKNVDKTVWCIVFNQNNYVWGNPLMRQGMAHTIDHQILGEGLPSGFTATPLLVPGAMELDGTSFRNYSIQQSPLSFDTRQGEFLYAQGMKVLGLEQLPQTFIYVPDFALQSLSLAHVQQNWQKYLNAYITFEGVGMEQIESRFYSGDYQILVMPITPDSSDLGLFLEMFSSGNSENHFGYHNPVYDELLADAALQTTVQATAGKYAQAETALLSDAVVIPLYTETTYYVTKDNVQGIGISSFGDRISFQGVEIVS